MSVPIIQMVDTLPPFPLLADVLRAFARADALGDMRELIDAIKREPTVTAKVIGVANSAYYSAGVPVYSVENAAARLGLRQLKITVLTLVLAKRFDASRCEGFNLGRFWYDAIMTAHCVLHLLDRTSPKFSADRSAMMCIGLVHSIGLLLMVEQFPDELAEVISKRAAAQGVGLSLEEPMRFGGENHYAIGSRLLKHWGLPPIFSEVVGNLAHPEAAGPEALFATMVSLAKRLVDAFAHGAELPALNVEPLLCLDQKGLDELGREMTRDHEAFYAFLPFLPVRTPHIVLSDQ